MVERAFLLIQKFDHLGKSGGGVGAGELCEFAAIAFADKAAGGVVGESGFKTIGVEEDGIAGRELRFAERELFIGENAEEGTVEFNFLGIAVGFQEHGQRVAGAGPLEFEGFGVENSIDHRDELAKRKLLADEFIIQMDEGFIGRNEAITGAGDFFGLQGAFDEDGEESGGHSVADGIGDEKTDMVFVKARRIVNITGDVGGGAEEYVEGNMVEGGESAGKKIDLEASGESHFLVDLRELRVEAGVEFSEHVIFALECVDDGPRGGESGEASGEFVGIAVERDRHEAIGGAHFMREIEIGGGIGQDDRADLAGDEFIQNVDQVFLVAVEVGGGGEEDGCGEVLLRDFFRGIVHGRDDESPVGAAKEVAESRRIGRKMIRHD